MSDRELILRYLLSYFCKRSFQNDGVCAEKVFGSLPSQLVVTRARDITEAASARLSCDLHLCLHQCVHRSRIWYTTDNWCDQACGLM